MSTRTSKLSLISSNVATDPFKQSDFVDNWATLDANPGLYICTSKTRPTWGAPQKGRGIIETDTWRQLLWSGSAWKEPLVAPGVWAFEGDPGQTLGPGTTVNWTMGTIDVTRPCVLTIINSIKANFYPIATPHGTWADFFGTVNGKVSNISNAHSGHVQWQQYPQRTNTSDYRAATFFGTWSATTPGKYIIGIKAITPSSNASGVLAQAMSTLILVTAPNGGNTNIS